MRITPDMYYLLIICLLAWVQSFGASYLTTVKMGQEWAVGPRDKPATDLPPMAGRLRRAYLNLMESLPIFAVLVLMTHLTEEFSFATLLGANLFFWARIVYIPAYLYDFPFSLRTLTWLVSIIGMFIMAGAIVL